jgi:superfamily II DNA or RNA helicase
MDTLKELNFRGEFRSYQQKVLDNAEKHLSDDHIHIVAAPGSGKTILGLELMRMLGKNALVLSPTLVISRQWGERFSERFLPDGRTEDEFVSYSMKNPRAITSVTYQTLHSAVKKQWAKEDAEESDADFREFDLAEFVKKQKIGTICLDEAHHLRREWERSLEGFLEMLPEGIKVIALTATPPYDSSSVEWNRYLNINGQIDDEIFVPELVAQGTLCPHQDYIYFNTPTEEERSNIEEFHRRAESCALELLESGLLAGAAEIAVSSLERNASSFFQYGSESTALTVASAQCGYTLPPRVLGKLGILKALPKYSISTLEQAVNHILNHPEVFTETVCQGINDICAKHRVLSHGKALMTSTEKVDKTIVGSLGKMESISKIASAEYLCLGSALRMCVLTDYIRKEHKGFIGSNERLDSMGVIPIFENLRRALPKEALVGVLSGSLIIWPTAALPSLLRTAGQNDMNMKSSPIGLTEYSEVIFDGGNRKKVAVITEAFRRGDVQILVGTAALLGEGWDSPCINSMVLASSAGSYVLSNQMRGRAIRTSADEPNKTANIWHLVTVEQGIEDIVLSGEEVVQKKLAGPESATDDNENNESLAFREPQGADFATLKRRFTCFFGPDYEGRELRSGVERVSIIEGPYTSKQLENINGQMLARATDRSLMAETWKNCIHRDLSVETNDVISSPLLSISKNGRPIGRFLSLVLSKKRIRGLCKSLLNSMKELSLIRSSDVKVLVQVDKFKNTVICTLGGGTVREKDLFAKAILEMLSPIDSPRYLAVRKSRFHAGYNLFHSYACPSFISNAKAAALLEKQLRRHLGHFSVVFTKNENGYWLLTACRNMSFTSVLNRKGKGIMRYLRAK